MADGALTWHMDYLPARAAGEKRNTNFAGCAHAFGEQTKEELIMNRVLSFGWVICLVALAALCLPSSAKAQTGVLYVVDDKVGIGTSTPVSTLEVTGTAGDAQVRVDENSSTVVKRFVLELENNGAPQFKFTDSSTATNWQFSMLSNGNFAIDRLGDTGAEMLIRTDGSVKIGPGGTQKFALDPTGNLTIQGTLTELSDVRAKQGFEAVDGAEVLSRLAGLPISEWMYRSDPTQARHVGPMAQDFYATFGLGPDNRHIAPRDMAGIALVAAQELQSQNAKLEAENDELRDRLDTLEALVYSLMDE
jgi:hypothetical protein